ncbi:flagellar hook-basal body complex protein [Sulfurimonas sp. SWIR-19]|uniref:flagellar hook-basal body complex protein n=1 Tax=Sulfurimonas sp. SWIR-19 TaxID=2878390 RepID=UPI001CF53BD8|nr:flagellar hook-basal body complex protein [Sulfurimonas sp. SWIR-19]UCN00368.1 flagellar hook-basal body complex protein [Sulfurimonas sp. SWIR-19]
MLKSLFSGVSGLQSHQVAMDVESNNIANVNTVGFKYSRANFSDLLAQTNAIATAPQGQLGGKNPVQIGLGSTASSTTRIFSQGSIQNSDKNTDVAIQGDGFFIISPDAGTTYKYTRAGDFKFDASGNFVDNNGFIAQGWLRDPVTGKVDSTAPIENINIPPGLTTPAQPTTEVVLKANLNSGPLVESYSRAYPIDATGVVSDYNGNTTGVNSGDVGFMFNSNGEAFSLQSGQGVTIDYGDGTIYNYEYQPDGTGDFQTLKQLRDKIQADVVNVSSTATVIVDDKGKIKIDNSVAGGGALNITVEPITATGVTENARFLTTMSALEGSLPNVTGAVAFSQDFNAATHSSSIDIFDSLGTKHTLRTEFRKVSASKWDMRITVPEPATISTAAPTNQVNGSITFNTDGSLSTYDPTSVSFTGNNGSAPNQTVNLSFGTPNKFDGMTSFDSKSATSGISQDGYTGGDLVGIRIDQSGTLIGSFSNGRSFGLAQIAMAKFTNNEGLATEGGNVYNQTANSGDPIIGTAATAGRGFIQSSALEASNVDLSRALTELIIIQRGFQANGKTITTSDQLLQTLIGLKQ